MEDIFNTVILPTLAAAITAIFGFIGVKIKAKYEEISNDKTKKAVVDTCVNAVEQLYKALDGVARLEKAKEAALEMLQEKGVPITELELNMLIEAAVLPLKHTLTTEETEVVTNG